MAKFDIAYKITIFENEGGYNPGIGEAETLYGIDRSQNPHWKGWRDLDAFKKGKTTSQINNIVKHDKKMQTDIMDFYLIGYWNPLQLTEIKDQQVANNLFDCNVNPCIDTASEVAQKACNVVKPKSLLVDGNLGNKSILVINSLSPLLLVTAINAIRSANYHHRITLSPKMKPWLNVWLNRLDPYNNLS